MGRDEFIAGLKALDYHVEDRPDGRIEFAYEVMVGSRAGLRTRIGLEVPGDFPLTPPPGPHVNALLHQQQGGGVHPTGGIHASPFGSDWQYWSRPYRGWKPGPQPVRQYLAHITNLWASQ